MHVEDTLTTKFPWETFWQQQKFCKRHRIVSKVWPIMVDKKMQFSNSVRLQKGIGGDKMETTICHFG